MAWLPLPDIFVSRPLGSRRLPTRSLSREPPSQRPAVPIPDRAAEKQGAAAVARFVLSRWAVSTGTRVISSTLRRGRAGRKGTVDDCDEDARCACPRQAARRKARQSEAWTGPQSRQEGHRSRRRSARKADATTLRDIADALNARGVPTARGGRSQAQTVANALARSRGLIAAGASAHKGERGKGKGERGKGKGERGKGKGERGRMFHFCFLAVEIAPRTIAKSSAPDRERKPPEIFCRSFIIRASRSA